MKGHNQNGELMEHNWGSCVNKFIGFGPTNFSMYTYPERPRVSCDVSSVLGPVSLIVMFRKHSEGEEGFLRYPCFILKIKMCTNLIGDFTTH